MEKAKTFYLLLFFLCTECFTKETLHCTVCTTECTVSPTYELKAKLHGFNKGEKVIKIEEIYLYIF